MLKVIDEPYHQMTIEELFDGNVKPNLYAVSRVFTAARKQMNATEYKVFAYALTHIKWQEQCPDVIYIDKKEAAQICGINSDADHLSGDLKRVIGDLAAHSLIEFAAADLNDGWENGLFIISVGFYKNRLKIRLHPDYVKLFGGLDSNFVTMWSGDIYKLHSKRSISFYEKLRENTDSRLEINTAEVGIKFFKELFDIPKQGEGSYMRAPSAKSTGGFDRTNFERKVIDPVCVDIANTDMIRLTVQENGKYYEKIKKNGRVIAYRFTWTYSKYPAVATAEEVKEINQDPRIAKVAADILQGKKKPPKKPSKKKSGFSDIEQHDYNFDELEKQLLNKNAEDAK